MQLYTYMVLERYQTNDKIDCLWTYDTLYLLYWYYSGHQVTLSNWYYDGNQYYVMPRMQCSEIVFSFYIIQL